MTKKQENYEKRWQVWREIWSERPHKSEVSGTPIYGELKSFYVDHLIEHHQNEELMFAKWNQIIVTEEEHRLKTGGNPLPKHKELILKAKERYEKETNA